MEKIDKSCHRRSALGISIGVVFAAALRLRKNHLPSAVHLMLAERSRRSGPGSIVGSPVAEVVVVQVDEILLSKPGGRLRLSRCRGQRQGQSGGEPK